MNLKSIKKNTGFKIATNSYLIILIGFIAWMFFFDENSYLTHKEFNSEIDDLETWIDYHKNKINRDKETIEKLKDSVELERYAREKYLMKKQNEDIYIIEFDTIKN